MPSSVALAALNPPMHHTCSSIRLRSSFTASLDLATLMAPVRRSCHHKAMTAAAVRGFVTRKHVRRKSGFLGCAHNKIPSSFCSIRRVYRTRTERPKRTRATLGFHRRSCWQTRRFFRCVDFFSASQTDGHWTDTRPLLYTSRCGRCLLT